MNRPQTESMTLRERLADASPLLAVELRPPRRDLVGTEAMESWIDLYQSIRQLSLIDTVLFLTDNAVGSGEEENLSHLLNNLGDDAARERIVPFLTLKHTRDYCLRYAERAKRSGFPALVVLGGDRQDGIPRCVDHSWQMRDALRVEQPSLLLGGWANPYRDAVQQVGFLADHADSLDFVLLQVVSHHDLDPVERFLLECQNARLELPMFAGVFHYRSARLRTLKRLQNFIPVPIDGIVADFAAGRTADQITAMSVKRLHQLGLTRFYLSNLSAHDAVTRLDRIAELAGFEAPSVTHPSR